jgi:hypothetical protein
VTSDHRVAGSSPAGCKSFIRADLQAPESVFDTFPWPQAPSPTQVLNVAEAGREIRRIRADLLPKLSGGLRALYRTLEEPGANRLREAHGALDLAVLQTYGFDPKRELISQLLDLNGSCAERLKRGEEVTYPGIPKDYPSADELLTEDCIAALTK